MAARVKWLPVGRIAHGYRRVFIVDEDGAVRVAALSIWSNRAM